VVKHPKVYIQDSGSHYHKENISVPMPYMIEEKMERISNPLYFFSIKSKIKILFCTSHDDIPQIFLSKALQESEEKFD